MLFVEPRPGPKEISALLAHGLHPRRRQLESIELAKLAERFRRWSAAASRRDLTRATPETTLVAFLGDVVREEIRRITSWRALFRAYGVGHSLAATDAERDQHVLDFARDLGASRRALRGDRIALKRWFGHDAVVDRYHHMVGSAERRATLALERCGALAGLVLEREGPSAGHELLWRRLDVEALFRDARRYEGDPRVGLAAFRCLLAALGGLPRELQERVVAEDTLRFIYRAALERSGDVWTQVEALSALQTLSLRDFTEVLRQRLGQAGAGDDLFVRRRAVLLLGANLSKVPDLADLLPTLCDDPSALVRQALAQVLHEAPADVALEAYARLTGADPVPQVRASALLQTPRLVVGRDLEAPVTSLFVTALRTERATFVLRAALKAARDTQAELLLRDPAAAERWLCAVAPGLEQLHVTADDLAVRRFAAQAREQMWCAADPAARRVADVLRSSVADLKADRSRRLPSALLDSADPATLARVLAILAIDDHGYHLRRTPFGRRIGRGERFGFRLWRMLHEFRRPSPDKRQAFDHTVGRIFLGRTQAPSAILAELAETKVPGEPLFMPDEAGWRPYLPLVDQAISAIDDGHLVELVTSEGVTRLVPPQGFLRRLRAKARLSWRFADFAQLRNWSRQSGRPPSAYLEALRALGFASEIRPHAGDRDPKPTLDPAVQRFFPAVLPLSMPQLWERVQISFFSIYQNTLFQLAIFVGLAACVFFGRHIYLGRRLRAARRRLALVVGGWGTRGKSGTERLKAGLFNALGYGLISKTTGCEAMFLHAFPFGPTREMFLFRPYDKATIWEQLNVVRLTPRLGGEVFLWECMGLSPSYVKVLQRNWMVDDIATITNTYPDHEDLQGPAGRNIPQVMLNFVPRSSRLLTSEEQMLPILKDGARALDTSVRTVGWLEAGLIPPDVLERFPYEEHPYNIALVTALADELGVESDFAQKEMADRVVPDLGVLKTYPLALVRTRRLEFVNGMSANERFGCLGNWSRMGFDQHDPEQEPGTWITTVVNNRADRVPRSRVFASILVADIAADRHVLIGGNLEGLIGYIEEAWQAHAGGLHLWPQGAQPTAEAGLQALEAGARRMRVPRGERQVQDMLRAMLAEQPGARDLDRLVGSWNRPDELRAELEAAAVADAQAIVAATGAAAAAHDAYRQLAERIRAAKEDPARLDLDFRDAMKRWFDQKIVVVEDYYASGDQIVARIVQETPPGFRNRIMGVQNIKGTGLDFIYRWQAWESCHAACVLARSDDPLTARRGLQALASFQEHGVLTTETVCATIDAVRERPSAQDDASRAELDAIRGRAEAGSGELNDARGPARGSTFLLRCLDGLEAILDAGDAVRRRKRADRIYADLATQRIGHERAALELQTLTKRQKGGWLAKWAKARSSGAH